MAAHQAPLSLGFSRQEHWSGLPFPSPMHESEKSKWSCSVMSDSSQPHGLQPTRLLGPWDFPGKSTGVGCHCLLWYFPLCIYKYFGIFFESLSVSQLSRSVVSDSLEPHGLQLARPPCPLPTPRVYSDFTNFYLHSLCVSICSSLKSYHTWKSVYSAQSLQGSSWENPL